MSSGDDLLNTLLNADDEDQAAEPQQLAPERRQQVAALRQAEVDEIRRLQAQRQRMEAEAEQLAAEQHHLAEELRRRRAQSRQQPQRYQPQPAPSPTTPRRKETAIVRGTTVDAVAVRLMRFGAIALLAMSFLGTVIAINGGWEPIIAAWPAPWQGISLLAAVVGLSLQGWITLIEWYQRRRKSGLLYLSHASVDVIFTYMGYAPILAPFFTAGLTDMGLVAWLATFLDQEPAVALVTLLATTIVGILSVILAVLPEQMLVE